MFNERNYDYDCTRKCRLAEHGNLITSALTKRSISDEHLSAYIAKTCCNFFDIQDSLGRSAVHLTSSVGRYSILEWLLNHGAIINGCDFESGSSPLHRAIYYGSIDCTVLLLRYGASLELLDEDTRCPLQSICRITDIDYATPLNEILVWGSNKNYNLGIGNEQSANAPQSVDFFRKNNISVKSVALGTYHSLFLDKNRNLYAVGHGQGGRLGQRDESSLTAPTKVKVPMKLTDEDIVCLSVSRKHSLVLTNRSLVYACGLNEDHQLGVRDAGEQLSNFREVVALRDIGVHGIERVIARDQHSIAYTEKSIYVWGANLGQFGINGKTKSIPTPTLMKLPPRTDIQCVQANNVATVVYTTDNVLLLYYHEKLKTIKTPNYEVLKSISLVGGDTKNAPKGTATALKMLILTKTNVLYFWYENTHSFYRCSLSQVRLMEIDKILYKSNQVLILSQGYVYKGKCNQVPVPESNKCKCKRRSIIDQWQDSDQNRTDISREHMIRIDLIRVPNIDRAVNIYCNDEFSSFAVLQDSHMRYFRPPMLRRKIYNFKKLQREASETDAVHDVVFHVGDEIFVAHKLIIYSRSPGLRDIVKGNSDKHIYLNFKQLTGAMFDIILKYLYANYLPSDNDIDCIRRSLGRDCPESSTKVCAILLEHVRHFQLKDLAAYLNTYISEQNFPRPGKAICRFNRLHRTDFQELYDVRIICEAERELQAHKCILVARLKYFEMMFMHTWAENSTINLSTVPFEYMAPILEFLYSSDVEDFRKQNYTESFLYNMIVYCDQFFIERLQAVCELLILDKITIRKCGEMFDFACMYNCVSLKRGCMDFICQNLARVLSYRSLEQCEPESLKCLNTHYRTMFKCVFDYRMITPESDAIEDELLLSYVDDFVVDLDYRMDEESEQKASKKKKELKGKQDVRQYEREAISSMMKTLNVSESQTSNSLDKSQAVQEAEKISAQLQNDAKSWLKVTDKKEHKRRLTDTTLKTNSTSLEEDKPIQKYMNMPSKSSENTMRQTPEKEAPLSPTDSLSVANTSYDIDLSQLTPQTQKLSQKQRKRLSSESKAANVVTSWRAPLAQATTPVAIPNAWGVVPSSPTSTFVDAKYSPPTGSTHDTSSFANMMRSNQSKQKTSATSPSEHNNSFSRILAEERRQRDQYERMQHKSLALTQIEETAITELREFYNADNISDEHIIIERNNLPSTMNFATWQRH